ncbi:hypothetical protein CL634_05205 [bacterium]|nr:hypothetical protein [bacterium]|tara:strand:+ start:83 stop:625 length:543 start_codon:yes stop_codon:yes gene_type:complete
MKYLATLLTLLLFGGCGTIRSSKDSAWVKKERAAGRDPVHIGSCGPDAVYDALHYIHRHIKFIRNPFSKKEISIIIQKRHTTACRNFYGIFDERAREISFISDLMAVLRHYNIGVYDLGSNDLKSVGKDRTAIVLIKKKNSLDYHWITYPVNGNITTFYGDDTVIKKIYVLFRLSDGAKL